MNMSIKNGFLFLLSLLKNPNLYVAAVVGSVPGGITGGGSWCFIWCFYYPSLWIVYRI
ncbi:hypothetical protein LLB_2983 [Legionella longbeachae D-4968]|nr:hypothetical protein LLB_2983 [Legionella longbeachae D-4968]